MLSAFAVSFLLFQKLPEKQKEVCTSAGTYVIPFFLASNYVPDMEPAKRKRFLIIEWVLVALLLVILIPLGVI